MLINSAETPNAYRNARTVLLNALEALGPHRENVTLVGGQAIYFHTQDKTDIVTVEMTTDADLAVDPHDLGAPPPTLEEALTRADFHLIHESRPGSWHQLITVPESTEQLSVEVDLLVPASLSAGTRGARLGPHGRRAARKAEGLEAALVDRAPALLRSLAAEDRRAYSVHIAGPGALLIAKMFKIRDRLETKDRVKNKDAADVLRLLIAVETTTLATTLNKLKETEACGVIVETGIDLFAQLCGQRNAAAIQMAQEALRGTDDPAQIAARFAALSEDLLEALSQRVRSRG